jgi:cAMP-dependent protein kinase regulator
MASSGIQQDRSPFSESNASSNFSANPFGFPPAQSQNPITNDQDQDQDEPSIPSYALGRRTSVSAESLVPSSQRTFPPQGNLESTLEEDETTPNPNSNQTPSFPKSDDQLARIKAAIQPNFLFRNLDEEQETDVLAAMKEVKIGAGEKIIEQGAAGDYFYVVESGKLEVFVKRDGQVLEEAKGDQASLGKKVATCVEGNSFGELALMHK